MLSEKNLIFSPKADSLKVVYPVLRSKKRQPHLHCYKHLIHGVPSNAEQLIFAMLRVSYIDTAQHFVPCDIPLTLRHDYFIICASSKLLSYYEFCAVLWSEW